MPSPVITAATAQIISGTAPPNAQIELYLADEVCPNACQGWTYIGSIQANAAGQWSISGALSPGARVTATATLQYTSQFSDCASVQGITLCPSDSLVLIDLYNASNGPSWTPSWNLSQPMNTWSGVSLSASGCVDTLLLAGNNLVGNLPASLGDLSELVLLNLSNNTLSGGIPPELGQLSSLNELNLSQNQLSGGIPATIGQLSALRGLYLNQNQLNNSIPAAITLLTQLVYLNLSENALSGSLPAGMNNLSSLKKCFLNTNQLSGDIPAAIGQLSQLQFLNLSINQFSGSIPSALSNLSSIDSMYLNQNMLTGCLDPLLKNLCPGNVISIANNPGLATQSWGNFCNNDEGMCTSTCDPHSDSLELVKLYNDTNGPGWTNPTNWLVPGKSIGEWYGVTTNPTGCVLAINLPNNNLIGTLPTLNFPELSELRLNLNALTGDLHGRLNTPKLQVLWLQTNKFYGTIPDFMFSNLGFLNVGNNDFTGTVPTFNPSVLQLLACGGNNLDSLPDLTYISTWGLEGNPNVFYIQGNRLTFDDVLPNMPIINAFPAASGYAPQDSIYSDTLITRLVGQSLTIDLGIDAGISTNQYQWFHNGNLLAPIIGNNKLIFNALTVLDTGMYWVHVTNPNAPNLTLYSRKITLQISPCISSTPPLITGPLTLCDGSATLLAGSFSQYAWSNGLSTPTIVVTQAGTYTVTVTDAGGCIGSDTQTVGASVPTPTPTITGPSALCSGAATLQAGSFTQYAWSNGFTTPTINVAQANTYTVTVTDANGCTGTDTQTVGASVPAPAPTITGPSALCSGSATMQAGSFTQYAWSNGLTTPTINVTQANTYTVTVTDANGCTGTDTQTVGASVPAPAPSITGPSALCSGSATMQAGSFAQYAWSNGLTTPSINVVQANTYTVTVTDANGCTGTDTQSVGANVPAPAPTITGPSALCSGSATMQAGSFAQYAWSNGFTTPSINVVQANTYTVTVTDANGCTGTDTQSVGANVPAPAPTITGPSALCSGSATMQAGSFAQYAWSNGLTTPSINVVQANTYTVTVTDANGCTGTDTQTVGASVPAPAPTITGPSALCSGAATLQVGSFAQYAWSNGFTTPSINVAQANTYTVTVTDANGCTGTDTQTVGASVPAPAPSITGPSTLCSGVATLQAGSFAQYAWSNGFTTPTINVTQANTYTVTVTDANGCTGTDSQIIASTTTPTAQLLATENSGVIGDLSVCAGDGAVFTAAGGIQYQFWVNGVAQTPGFVASNTLSLPSLLTATTVQVVVMDLNTCRDTTQAGEGIAREPITLNINALPNLSAFSSTLLTACPGDSLRILLSAPNLANGTYTVQFNLNNGATQTATISFSAGIGILPLGQLPPQNNTVCKIQQISTLVTNCAVAPAVGGSLTFDVRPTIQSSLDTTICSLQSIIIGGQTYNQAGTYTIPLKTAANCDSILTLTLTTVPMINLPKTASFCDGGYYIFYGDTLKTTGAYQHTAAGALGCDTLVQLMLTERLPIVSNISRTACPGMPYQLGDSTFTTSGIYQVILTSYTGCDSIVNLLLQVSSLNLSISASVADICAGNSATLTPMASNCPGCQYKWSTGATQSSALSVAPTASTEYSLTITDAIGCKFADTVLVTVHDTYDQELEMILCPGDTIRNGTQTITKPGTYFLDFQTAFGCDSLVMLTLNSFDASQLVAASDSVTLPPDGTTTLAFKVTDNDVRGIAYLLTIITPPTAGSVVTIGDEDLRYTLTNLDFYGYDSLEYALCPEAACLESCSSAWVYVRTQAGSLEEVKKLIPNVITPAQAGDKDTVNDIFDPVQVLLDNAIEIEESELFIVNRWGEVVFHQERGPGQGNDWDGMQEGRVLPQATYYYRLRVVSGMKSFQLQGPVNLLR